MNFINFLGRSNFPLSSETMQYLQEMVYVASKCASIGGDTYILYGCEEKGLQVSDGYVVVKGEILPFVGGTKQTTVYIKEVRRDVTASGYNFPEVYQTRTCGFGIGSNQLSWSDFKRIETNNELTKRIDDLAENLKGLQGIPKGIITMWSGTVEEIPQGWVLCTGQNGTPNLQGKFVVAYSTTDEDYDAIGKTGGAKEIALNADQNGEHSHSLSSFIKSSGNWKAGGNDNGTDFVVKDSQSTTAASGSGKPHENRPPYYVLAYIMKL